MYALRNYNRFVTGSRDNPQWTDFGVHRFDTDYKRLVKFDTREEAQSFLDAHPELENTFDAWIVETDPANWN